MKKAMLTGILVLGLMGLTSSAKAETLFGDYLKDMGVEVEISAAIDYYNKYVWRGFLLDNDSVIQPSVTLGAAGFEGGFWGSWDVNNDDANMLNSDEVDGWISYNFDLGFIDESLAMVGVSVGNTWYNFPQGSTGLSDGSHAAEMYVSLSLDTLLSPYFTYVNDYSDEASGGADGQYYMFGIGHSITLCESYGVSLDLGYELGLNDDAFIVGDGGYNLITAGFTVPLTEKVTFAPVIAYSSPFGDLADAQDDQFYAGASLSFAM